MSENIRDWLKVSDVRNRAGVSLDADPPTIIVGRETKPGTVRVLDENGDGVFHVGGGARVTQCLILSTKDLRCTGKDNDEIRLRYFNGRLFLMDTELWLSAGGKNRVVILPQSGNLWLGGNGKDGDLVIFPSGAENKGDGSNTADATFHFDGDKGAVLIRGRKPDGSVMNRMVIKSDSGNVWIGGSGKDGDLLLLPRDVENKGDSTDRDDATIHLDADSGDIRLANADCAENFDMVDDVVAEPGSVCIAQNENELALCSRPYDRRVIGVVSGAGGLKPGIILNNRKNAPNQRPIALSGKVYCKVDAQFGPIDVGDLLTTSLTPGYAMRASDPSLAFGAVIGKTLAPLSAGKGLVPALVALQ